MLKPIVEYSIYIKWKGSLRLTKVFYVPSIVGYFVKVVKSEIIKLHKTTKKDWPISNCLMRDPPWGYISWCILDAPLYPFSSIDWAFKCSIPKIPTWNPSLHARSTRTTVSNIIFIRGPPKSSELYEFVIPTNITKTYTKTTKVANMYFVASIILQKKSKMSIADNFPLLPVRKRQSENKEFSINDGTSENYMMTWFFMYLLNYWTSYLSGPLSMQKDIKVHLKYISLCILKGDLASSSCLLDNRS